MCYKSGVFPYVIANFNKRSPICIKPEADRKAQKRNFWSTMPFTPLHMGPGMAFKAVLGQRMSLIAFGISQIVIDIEPLVRIIRGDAVLHGATHTIMGALILAPFSAVIARLAGPWILKVWMLLLEREHLVWLKEDLSISNGPILAGAFIGSLSHIFLDSLMHADMIPFAPFGSDNLLLHFVSYDVLHLSCLASGALGLCVWTAIRRRSSVNRKT